MTHSMIEFDNYSPDELTSLFIRGCNFNKIRDDDEYLIHRYARLGNVANFRVLLASGIHPDSPDDCGRTPLHVACRYGQFEIAQILIGCGVDEKLDIFGRNAIHNGNFENKSDIIQSLIFKCKLNPNRTDWSGALPLISQLEHKHFKSAIELCSFGADPYLFDNDGQSAVWWCQEKKEKKLEKQMKQCYDNYLKDLEAFREDLKIWRI